MITMDVVLQKLAANFNTNLPLAYYNRLAVIVGSKEEPSSFSSAPRVFFNPCIPNPNTFNRHSSYPIIIRTNIEKDEQVQILELILVCIKFLQG